MSQTLDKGYIEKKEKGSGEYQELYLEGIEFLQKLSGGIWTDYNEHDPGVTIFENLAYTLTNLSYKVDMPLIDILTESKKRELVSGDNGYFIPSEILTTNPVIKEDYRKMLVDGIRNVKNVWIRTHNQDRKGLEMGKLNLQGLYHVFIEMYEYDNEADALEKEEDRVRNKAKELYHAQRNLCEDLCDVTVLQPLNLKMLLHLTLDMEADGEAVFGQIYYNINDFLTHEAKFESLWELQEQDEDINSIYEGPALSHGFVRDKELRELKSTIYVSDLTKIISKVPGVVSIDKFEIKPEDQEGEKPRSDKAILVPPNLTPRFELPDEKEAEMNLQFKTADISLIPNFREIKKRYTSIEAEHYGNFKTVSDSSNKAQIPAGEALGIPSFYSMREQFPAIYGIGKFGMPQTVTKRREAQARQLKAYLLPFDQLMANFLAHLNHVSTLFDPTETELQTYFYQELEDMPNLVELIKHNHEIDKDTLEQWKDILAELNRNFDTQAIQRLNQVTDTLLGRFAEDFPTYVLQKINTSCFGKNFTDKEFDKKLLLWKRKLISNYGHLSYNRARSFNYRIKGAAYASPGVSHGLPVIVEKISILLGIRHAELRNLSEIMYHTKYSAELIIDAKPKDYGSSDFKIFEQLYKSIREYALSKDIDDAKLKNFFQLGVNESNYQILDRSEAKVDSDLRLKDSSKLLLLRNNSIDRVEKAKTHAVKLMKKLNEKTEGIHLLEHILLAPPAAGNYFGFSFNITTRKLQDQPDEQIEFEHASLKSSGQRNRDLDTIKNAMETGSLLEYRATERHGHYRIEIFKAHHGPLAQSCSQFESRVAVDKQVKALDALQDRVRTYSLDKLNYFAFLNERKINESFFSFRMTFILPSWPVRFQQDSFKVQFNNILYQQAPIHIQYHTHWLGLSEMNTFEKAYFKWHAILPDANNIQERMVRANILIEILQGFETPHDEE